jgi:serine/threonine protein kinase
MTRTDPMIGTQLGDYKIVSLLGKGGMARVYRGRDPNLERDAAVKIIDKGVAQPEYRERFQREARAIAKLHHPRIVHVYQFGETEDHFYMAMVFIEGRDLAHMIREARHLEQLIPVTKVMRIIHDVAEALDYAHAQGVIHRDVKPSNIMVTTEGRAVLTDFGLALSVSEGTIGSTFGTAHYIAPEQAVSSANAVPQSDQYSLGVVAYQLLTGRVPFDDPGITNIVLKHLNQTPAAPSSVNPYLPSGVDAALLRALEKTPDLRYPTCAAMILALQEVLEEVRPQQTDTHLLDDWDDPPPLPTDLALQTDVDRPTTVSVPSTDIAEKLPIKERMLPDVLPMDDTPLMTPIPGESSRPPPPTTPAASSSSQPASLGSLPAIAAARKTSEQAAGAPRRTSETSAAPRRTGETPPVRRTGESAIARRTAELAAARRRQRTLIAGGAVALVALFVVVVALIGLGVFNPTTDTTPTAAAVVAEATETETPTPGRTRRSPTYTRTPAAATETRRAAVVGSSTTPESAGVVAETTAEETPPDMTAEQTEAVIPTSRLTRTPRASATNTRAIASWTPRPTNTPDAAATAAARADAAAGIVMIYDGDTFVMYNRGTSAVNIGEWMFVQVNVSGIEYDAAQWADNGGSIDNLNANECVQLWRITLANFPAPDDCAIRAAWRSVGQRRWFWISSSAGATFEIREGDTVLATCPTVMQSTREGTSESVTCEIVSQG